MAAPRRLHRVNDLIRDELAELLAREADDPALRGVISITGVETSPDLSSARVHVSVLGSDEEAEATVGRLRHAASFFRRQLALRVNLRRTPELDFRLDRSIAEGARIEQILRDVIPE